MEVCDRYPIDGIDLDYFFSADGSADARPEHLGCEVPLAPPRSFRLDGLVTLVPLESSRVEEFFDRPHYRVSSNRSMPLHSEYFRATASGPCFLVPELPEDVIHAVGQMMRRDPGRWGSYLETSR